MIDMYRSSSMTFVYKYIFTPLWGGGFLFGIIFSWNKEGQFFYDWSRGAALMVSYAMVWLIIMMKRLKNVETAHDYLIIDTIKGEKKIDYADITWIYQIAMMHPAMISIKYFDHEKGDYNKILILPSMSSQLFSFNFLMENEMTEFIRDKIKSRKPDYSRENEPSRWLPLIYIAITSLPIVLIVNYFFSSSLK